MKNAMIQYKLRGVSSSGRASPSQGEGGGFESHTPLHMNKNRHEMAHASKNVKKAVDS